MRKRCAYLLAAILLSHPAAVSAATMINGEVFDPTREQCLDAIENGVQLTGAAEDMSIPVIYIYYDERMFAIRTRGGNINCVAWKV